MAEARRNDHDNGIPSGSNRIKTRGGISKDHPSSKPEELTESRSYGVSWPTQKQKMKTASQGHVKLTISSKEEVPTRKRIARCFTSYISKFNNVSPNPENSSSEVKDVDEEDPTRTKLCHEGNHLSEKQSSEEQASCNKVPKSLKSFSEELGPKGGIPSAYPRTHSYNDLKELLDTLHSRFEAAKEMANSELLIEHKLVLCNEISSLLNISILANLYTISSTDYSFYIIFDNILNRKVPWPHVPSDMSFEAQDLINRFFLSVQMDECGELADFSSPPLDLSLINFSFKNLSQLASINHEVLVQNAKDPTKLSPAKGPGT